MNKAGVSIIVLTLACSPFSTTDAILPVIDEAGLVQTIVLVTSAGQRLSALYTQIDQFTTRIKQATRNLETLGAVIPPEVKTAIGTYMTFAKRTLKVLRGRRFNLHTAMEAYREVYHKEQPTLDDVTTWLQHAEEAVQDAYHMEAITISGLDNGHEILGKLLTLLMESGGNLQALQAIGQHQMTTNEQLQQWRAEYAVSQRRESAMRAMEIAESKRWHTRTMEAAKGLLTPPK